MSGSCHARVRYSAHIDGSEGNPYDAIPVIRARLSVLIDQALQERHQQGAAEFSRRERYLKFVVIERVMGIMGNAKVIRNLSDIDQFTRQTLRRVLADELARARREEEDGMGYDELCSIHYRKSPEDQNKLRAGRARRGRGGHE